MTVVERDAGAAVLGGTRRTAGGEPDRAVAWWLIACCAMVYAMVVIGGVTRLTESGLSIVTWSPIGGAVPPLDHDDWLALFERYKTSPQFKLVNAAMTIEEFRSIFWWEYIHRLWGRAIGLVFFVPFLILLARGRIARRLRWPLAGVFALGGLQGLIGWWMVASGLNDVPWVSPYRLTLHLGTALVIYAAMLWVALGVIGDRARGGRPGALSLPTKLSLGLVFLTILAGGFVAGSGAGRIYNEFPLMGGALVPSDYFDPALSLVRNAFENLAAIQLHHRALAIGTLVTVLALATAILRGGFDRRSRALAAGFALMVCVQAGLGISTLLSGVPLGLAAAHQAGAVALLTFALVTAYRFR